MYRNRLNSITFVILLFLAAAMTSACSKKSTPVSRPIPVSKPLRGISTADMEFSILYYVNIHRRSKGLIPIQLNSVEASVAQQHSRNMAEGRTAFGHGGLSLRLHTIERQLGPVNAIAENVAYGEMTAKEVVDSWLRSSVHRKNIEGSFILTGIGWAKNNHGMIYYTEIFTR